MKLEELNKIEINERLDLLNNNKDLNADIIFDQLDDREDFDDVCAECYAAVSGVGIGTEGVSVCSSCRTIEGKVLTVSMSPSLGLAYIYDTSTWIKYSEDIGGEY